MPDARATAADSRMRATPGQARSVAMIAAPWIAAAAIWLALRPGGDPGRPLTLLTLIALAALSHTSQVYFEYRRQTFSLSLAELPFVLGLFLLPPMGLILVRMSGAAAVPLFRRVLRTKDLFNIGVAALEVMVALVVLHGIDEHPIGEPRSWLIALAAIIAADLAAAAMVLLAITNAQGWLGVNMMATLVGQTVTIAALNTVVGLIALLVIDVNNWAALLLLVVLAVVVAAFRAYKRFVLQHHSLGQVYEFSRLVESARGDLSSFDDALQQLREAFNAAAVVMRIEPVEGQDTVSLRADETGVRPVTDIGGSDPLCERLTGMREGLLLHRRSVDRTILRGALDARGSDEVMAVPLRVNRGLIGFLEVHDRLGQMTTFTQDDLRLLRNFASHLTSALENQQLVERLRHEARHDRLTGLPNREWFTLSVDEAIAAIPAGSKSGPDRDRRQGLVAVFLLDLDSFKDVNDSLGHDYGDRLLITVGRRLRSHLPQESVVARMGADEFAVLSRAPDLATAERQATELHEMLSQPYPLAGLSVHVGSCVGLAVAPDHALDGGTLLQRADVALYSAKSKGRAVATYLPTMEQASVHRLQLVTQLREALDSGQVTVRYQPKIAMATKELMGVEALVRWEHPQYGTVVPDDFVPLAERTGLIGPLTMHVIGASLRQCRSWLDRDLRIGVAVNLSVRNLLDVDFPDRVEEIRSDIGVPADLLAFEITESSVMSDPERSLPVLHRLHELGVGLSIDDFGTGYSSLAYLRRLPVDEVKIDKVFVLGMGTDLGDLAIVRAIIELGHSLGLRVVAEGVEDELARDLLEGMDCDIAQGFLVSRALAPDRLDAWFTARTITRPAQPGVRGRRLLITA